MRLPEMTPLQFIVVHLLFHGEKTGHQLRQQLDQWEGTRTSTAFSRLMTRMVYDSYVEVDYGTDVVRGQAVRECVYRVTDLGVILWKATRRFHMSFAPPPPDLEATPVEEAEFAAHPPKKRKALLKKRIAKRLIKSFRPLLEQ